MKLVTVAEMKAIEEEANQGGLSYAAMMENAGGGLAAVVHNSYSQKGIKKILGLIGSGNNGGDALIALEALARNGWVPTAYLVRNRPKEENLSARLQDAGGVVIPRDEVTGYQTLKELLEETDLILDGIVGTGVQPPLRKDISDVLQIAVDMVQKREVKPIVVAVDCPSGVDCDSGAADENSLPADLTVSMAAVKTGLVRSPASNLVGQIRVVDIGLEAALPTWEGIGDRVVDRQMVKNVLPKRPKDAHKGSFGTALVIAGSVNYTGAALLAGRAAYRAGTGLVTLAVPGPLHAPLAGQLPEATWLLLPHAMGVISADAADVIQTTLNQASAVLIGPGWGQEGPTGQFLSRLLAMEMKHRRASMGFVQRQDQTVPVPELHLPPMVVDADALKLLTKIPDWAKRLPANCVLTPHPGEMGVLTGLTTAEIQKDRMDIARRFAQEWRQVVVLKGANTLVANPDGRLFVNPIATPALARAGTGDVLAGIITGLLAQGVPPFEAAYAGAWLHGMGGLMAEKTIGNSASVLAGDVLDGFVRVMGTLETPEELI